MRIMLVTRIFEPEPGAASQRLSALCGALADRGHQLTVVTSHPPPKLRPVDDSDQPFRLRRLPVLRDRTGYLRGYLPYLSFDVPVFLRLLFGRRQDLFVVEPPPTTGVAVLVAAALRRKPYIYYAADVWSDAVDAMGGGGIVSRLLRSVERRVLGRAVRVLSVSEGVTERVVDMGTDADRVVTLGNGVNTEIFTSDVEPQRPGYPYFVYTGTMSEWQRPAVFVDALQRIAQDWPDVCIHFFGQGSEVASTRVRAEEVLPGRVFFDSMIPAEAVAGWLRGAVAALVSIVPGQGYDLARPTKTYAAAACGTAVIFAGPANATALVRAEKLGQGVAFDAESIAVAMQTALKECSDEAAPLRAAYRAQWARTHASLTSIAQRAVASIDATMKE